MINIRTISILILTAILLSSASCDKNDDNPDPERYIPTDVDRARCAHINQEAELGGYLYNLCLVNPWPTELPEVEVGGERVLAAWINDTLSFVAKNTQESPSFNIQLVSYEDGRITLEGQRNTWDAIDPTYLSFFMSFYDDDSIQRARFRISNHELRGNYEAILSESAIFFQRHEGYASGTFNLVLIDSTTNNRLTLTDGRFHAPF